MLGRRSRILIAVALLATLALGAGVHHLQNTSGAMGGRISQPKLAWLLYTVMVWGFLCPILALEPGVHRSFRLLVGWFGVSMWIRAAAEFPMLYTWKNWRPPYGMVHDLICVLFLTGGLLAMRAAWWPPRSRSDRWMFAFVLVLALALLVECTYAGLFYQAVGGATTGHEGLWFAAPDDPRFVFINGLTLTFNLLLYTFLAVFLVVAFTAPSPAEPARAPR
jgi:hypothetical protein